MLYVCYMLYIQDDKEGGPVLAQQAETVYMLLYR